VYRLAGCHRVFRNSRRCGKARRAVSGRPIWFPHHVAARGATGGLCADARCTHV